jgi:eukaryotic-like serine/threonine-protein kinase
MAMQDTPAPVQTGDIFAGKYVIERVLGAGAVGVVVAASHAQLGDKVALKFLRAEVAERTDVVARFLREARAAVRIKNEHVARILDVGTTDGGLPFIVMEYLEGCDLHKLLQTLGSLPIAEGVEYVVQACLAMVEAHATGVVHRDLKPSNLFLTQRADGSPLVKVLDFGISKIMAGESDRTDLTSTNGILGSPLYISPEQARSARSVDARADVWSLGVILHHLLAGQPPFAGDSITEVLSAILFAAPKRLRVACPDAPAELEAILLRCLEREVAQRMPSVAQLALELAPWAQAESRAAISRLAGTPPPPLWAPLSSPPTAAQADAPVRTMTGWTASGQRTKTMDVVVRVLALCAVLALLGVGSTWLVRHGRTESATEPAASAGVWPGAPVAPMASELSPQAESPLVAAAAPTRVERVVASASSGIRSPDPAARQPKPPKPAASRPPSTPSSKAAPSAPAARPIDPVNLTFDLGAPPGTQTPKR